MNAVTRMMEDIFAGDNQYVAQVLNYDDGLNESIVADATSPEWMAETSLKLEQSFSMDADAWARMEISTPPLSSGVPSPTQELDQLEIEMDFAGKAVGEQVGGSPLLARRAGKNGAKGVAPITMSAPGDVSLWNQMLVSGVPYTPPMSALTTPATSPMGSPRRTSTGSSGGHFVEPSKFFPTLLINDDEAGNHGNKSSKKGSAKRGRKSSAKAAKAAARAAAVLAKHAGRDAEEDEEIDVVSFEDVQAPPTPAASPSRTPERQASVTSESAAGLAASVAEAMLGVDGAEVTCPEDVAEEKRALMTAVRDADAAGATPGATPSLKRKASVFGDDVSAAAAAAHLDDMPAPSPIPKRTRRSLVAELRAASPGMAIDNEEEKRNIHNVLERKRRNDLKSSFELLKDKIPELLDNDRAPKVLILQKATEFIHTLKLKDTQMEAAREELRKENAALLERLQAANKKVSAK